MNVNFLFEALAASTHLQKHNLINQLPNAIQTALVQQDSQKLRRILSEELVFPDVQTIVQINHDN